MSEAIVIGLIGALTGSLVGSLVTALMSLRITKLNLDAQERAHRDEQGHQERLRDQENAEWRGRLLFEKRLAALPAWHDWLMKLNVALNKANADEASAPENRELDRIAIEARAWYDQNSEFMQRVHTSTSNFVGLTNAAGNYANRGGHDTASMAWDNFFAADRDYQAMRDWVFSYELLAPSNQNHPEV